MAINEVQSDILIGAYSVRWWDGAICMSVTPERSDFFMLESILNLLFYLLWDGQLIIVNCSSPSALYKVINH